MNSVLSTNRRYNVSQRENRRNPHLRDNHEIKPYHDLIADLAIQYTDPAGEVIEIGSGMGHIPKLIKSRSPMLNVSVTDIDSEFLDKISASIDVKETFHVADVVNLVEIGKQWDTVVVSHVLEHMHRPYDAILDLMKILPDGGHAILAVPNPVRPTVFFGNVFRRHYANKGHVHAWDRSHWINFLEEIVGVNVVAYYSDFVPVLPDQMKVKISLRLPRCARLILLFEKSLARVFPWWAFSNIAVIKK